MQPTADKRAAPVPPPVVRPVTVKDPAWFCCGRLRMKDGTVNPDYGCVFWAECSRGVVMFTFDRKGDLHAATYGPQHELPDGEWFEKQGRLFRIVGPSDTHDRWVAYGFGRASRMSAPVSEAA